MLEQIDQQESINNRDHENIEDRYNHNILANYQLLRNLRSEVHKNNDGVVRLLAGISSQLHIIQERLTRIESKSGGSVSSGSLRKETQPLQKRNFNQKNVWEDENDWLSGSEGVHRLCLQENITKLVNQLDLTNTHLLDELIEDDCLTDNEATLITKNNDRRNQVRKLVYLISRRSKSKFVKFIEKLQRSHNYPHIAKDLTESFQTKLSQGFQNPECLMCVIKRDVDIAHVAEKLCQCSIVDLEFLDMVASRDPSISHDQSNLWEVVFAKINQSNNKHQAVRKLQEALSVKYEHIAAKLNLYFAKQIACHCGESNNQMMLSNFPMSFAGSFGSLSDISTTSEVKSQLRKFSAAGILQSPTVSSTTGDSVRPDNLPRTIEWLESIENGGFSSLSDVDCRSLTFSHIKDSFEQLDENQEEGSGSVSDGENINIRHSKKDEQNLQTSSGTETKKINSHAESSTAQNSTSKSSIPLHTVGTTKRNVQIKFRTFDHHYSSSQKFTDTELKDFTFSRPDPCEEPTIKKKKRSKRRSKGAIAKESNNQNKTNFRNISPNSISLDNNANMLDGTRGAETDQRNDSNAKIDIVDLSNEVKSLSLSPETAGSTDLKEIVQN